ncbi:MAG: presenilin-like A22 family membrane protease [Candidatus Woesearchaeota archaeon]|jgi:presenilin-like A22 family membrane protease
MKPLLPPVTRLIILFIIAQLIGVAVLAQYIDFESSALGQETVINEDKYFIPPPDVHNENTSFVYILLALVIGTFFIILIIKYQTYLVWKFWFFTSVLISLMLALYPFALLLFISQKHAFVLTLLVAVALAYLKISERNLTAHTVVELLMYGGLAALFVPIVNVFSAVILLIILSGYDYYMVNKSKKMQLIATEQIKHDMVAGLYVSSDNKLHTKNAPKGKGEGDVMIGGGDIAFPLIFTGAVMKTYGTIDVGFITTLGAALGVIVLFLFAKRNTFYPAMPFITVGCLLSLLFI